jgi:stage II sporulation protein R
MKRKIIKFAFCFLAAFLSSLFFTSAICVQNMQTAFDKNLYGNIIRLHILAESDSEADQRAKLAVKDEVSDYIYSLVSSCENREEAERIINENLSSIDEKVKESVTALGYSYETSISFGEEYYPVRYYENFTFPSGIYKSLKITLGSGKGKNWWCVLYPTVCNSMATSVETKLCESGVDKKTAEIICSDDRKYEYGMFFLELFKRKK